MQQPNIYREKVTGARPHWHELNRMLGKWIDPLTRRTFDLFGIVERIVDAKAQFRSLVEPWTDTGTTTGRLMLGVFLGSAILFAPAPPKAAAGRRSAVSASAANRI